MKPDGQTDNLEEFLFGDKKQVMKDRKAFFHEMASILLVNSTKCNEFYHAFPDKKIESLKELLLKYGYENGDLTEIKGLERKYSIQKALLSTILI